MAPSIFYNEVTQNFIVGGSRGAMEEEIRFSALKVRDFRLFWLTQIVSLSGTWMQQVAIGWLVYTLTSSPFTLGLTMMIMSAPIMLFTLFGGITADRYPKKNIIILTQVLFIVPAFALGVISGMETVTMWHVYLLVFAIGVLNAFDTPARQSFIVELVGKGNLLNAIGLNAAAFHGARILGPMLAGFLIAHMGVRSCFFLNALSYIPVIGVLMMVKERGADRIRGERSVMQDLADGLSYIRGQKRLLPLFLIIAVISLFGLPYSSFLPVIAQDVLHTGASGLGRLAASAGAGAFVAAVYIASRGKVRRRVLFTSIALIVATASLLVLTFSRSEALSLTMLGIAGWGWVSFFAVSNNFIQLTVPDGLRGRIMSVYILLFLGMAPAGNFIVGSIAERIGTMNSLRAAAIVCLASSGAFILHQRGFSKTVRESPEESG